MSCHHVNDTVSSTKRVDLEAVLEPVPIEVTPQTRQGDDDMDNKEDAQEPILPLYTISNAHSKPRPKHVKRMTLTVQIPQTSIRLSKSDLPKEPPPARWGTLEFKIYYVIALAVIPTVIWIPVSLSLRSHPNYPVLSEKLKYDWLLKCLIDESDAPYISFRKNIPYMITTATLFQLSKYITGTFFENTEGPMHLLPLNVVFSVPILIALHGSGVLGLIIFVTGNYFIIKRFHGSDMGPIFAWIFNVCCVLLVEGFLLHRFEDFPASVAFEHRRGHLFHYPVGLRMTMLRQISFDMDFYWACNQKDRIEVEDERRSTAHPQEMYSFKNYICYLLYPPLYIYGPIITFNDFFWQHRKPTAVTSGHKLVYFLRFVAAFLTMEIILHFVFVGTIRDRHALSGDTAIQLALIAVWNLMVLWLKFLIRWRFSRLWALLDNIDAPENITRCLANNYSMMGFVKSWNVSLNLWIGRYIYTPLSGRYNILNTVLVYYFVFVWHNFHFIFIAISSLIIPEIIGNYLFSHKKYYSTIWYRHLCVLGTALKIFVMAVAVILFWFKMGVFLVKDFVMRIHEYFWVEGILSLLAIFGSLFVGVQFMFEFRAEEMRKGINRKY